MNTLQLSSVLTLALLTACQSTRSSDVDIEASMQEYMRLGTPGPEHEELARQVGTWKTTMRNRHDADGEWMTMDATAVYEPMFGGRFVIARERGSFEMDGQQIPHESMMILGFDNLQQEWTSRYYSSMSTWSGEMRGKKNAKGEIEFSGLHVDHLTPEGRPSKAVSRWEGDDKMVFEMWDSIDGEMVLVLTWEAVRQP